MAHMSEHFVAAGGVLGDGGVLLEEAGHWRMGLTVTALLVPTGLSVSWLQMQHHQLHMLPGHGSPCFPHHCRCITSNDEPNTTTDIPKWTGERPEAPSLHKEPRATKGCQESPGNSTSVSYTGPNGQPGTHVRNIDWVLWDCFWNKHSDTDENRGDKIPLMHWSQESSRKASIPVSILILCSHHKVGQFLRNCMWPSARY